MSARLTANNATGMWDVYLGATLIATSYSHAFAMGVMARLDRDHMSFELDPPLVDRSALAALGAHVLGGV